MKGNRNKMLKKLFNILKSFRISTIIGIIGAIGGQGPKWIKRFVIPIIFTFFALGYIRNFWCLTIMSMSIFLSMGYGIPSWDDEGSKLGQYFYKLFKSNEVWANIFTRGIIGLGIALSFLSVPILKGNWFQYLLGSLGIILVWALNSWRGYGILKVKIFGKEYECLKVDFVTYFVTSICGLMIIMKG